MSQAYWTSNYGHLDDRCPLPHAGDVEIVSGKFFRKLPIAWSRRQTSHALPRRHRYRATPRGFHLWQVGGTVRDGAVFSPDRSRPSP